MATTEADDDDMPKDIKRRSRLSCTIEELADVLMPCAEKDEKSFIRHPTCQNVADAIVDPKRCLEHEILAKCHALGMNFTKKQAEGAMRNVLQKFRCGVIRKNSKSDHVVHLCLWHTTCRSTPSGLAASFNSPSA